MHAEQGHFHGCEGKDAQETAYYIGDRRKIAPNVGHPSNFEVNTFY